MMNDEVRSELGRWLWFVWAVVAPLGVGGAGGQGGLKLCHPEEAASIEFGNVEGVIAAVSKDEVSSNDEYRMMNDEVRSELGRWLWFVWAVVAPLRGWGAGGKLILLHHAPPCYPDPKGCPRFH